MSFSYLVFWSAWTPAASPLINDLWERDEQTSGVNKQKAAATSQISDMEHLMDLF